uniref:hybrid sensor histidine kinase/response regulator n=1 Tax=Paractinoplanes polyasparticus TaxID=2856853 RepID=UPI001C84A783|nr:PAS domain S-box protein [Actinoplanes polyasparticus]
MGETYGSTRSEVPALIGAMVRSAHDAIWTVGPGFTVQSWNPAAETLLGWAAGEIVGRSADLLVPPDRRDDQREMLTLLTAGARIERFRTQRRHRDGHWVLVTLSMSPLSDGEEHLGFTVIARAVGHRERLESSLQALLEAAPDAFVGISDDGRVVLANVQAEQLFGETRNGLLDRPIDDLLDVPLTDSPDPGAEPATARRMDGSTVPVEVSMSPLPTEEGRLRCAVIRDITERVRAQDRVRQLQAEAERARLDAQLQRTQRLEGLGQLAGGVAHDFNNLIAVIANYATFIEESAADAGLEEISGDAAQITKAAQRGADLTHQLLAFARREVVRPRPLDVNDVIADIEQMLRRSIGEHITLSVRLADSLPSVTADPGQLDQVLVNLAVNARDAMPRGGQLSIESQVVDVDADYAAGRPHLRPGRYVRLQVSDTGTGMPPEVIERAFEPFYTTKPAGQGTGLGLATVYGIVTAAGGDLHIYSEQGMGTTFTILLPSTDAAPAPIEREAEVAPHDARRGTVLAVEDEPALRGVLTRILRAAGHEVLIAADGPAALALADAHEGPIDVLLTDVVMPHMLGRELAERFADRHPGTRVLFMSGYARPVLASQGTLAPGVTLVEKPFSKNQLLAALQKVMEP